MRRVCRVGAVVTIATFLGACAAPPSAVTINDAPLVDTTAAASLEPVAVEPMDLVGSIAPAPVAAAAVAAPVLAAPIVTTPPPDYTPIAPTAQACCKVCTKGKACGNTCIARNKTCRVGRGCACDG